jgi:acetyl-CoA C-acetyltransferase
MVSSLSKRFPNGYGTAYDGIWLVNGARTPLGKIKGALSNLNAKQLGVLAAKAALERSAVDLDTVDEVVFANAHPSSCDALFLPRHLALEVGLSTETPALLVQRICGSGVQVLASAADQIVSGRARVVLAGGADTTSRTPTVSFSTRMGFAFGSGPVFEDLFFKALIDSHIGSPLGVTGENLATKHNISRDEVDEFAYESHTRARKAVDEDLLKDEIVPVKSHKGVRLSGVSELVKDETPRKETCREALANLKPVFREDGVQTAGNSCALADGAGAFVVAGDDEVNRQRLSPIGRIVSVGVCGVEPAEMGIGPAPASEIALEMAHLSRGDIDLWEINEAFAAQVLACQKVLQIDRERLNVRGGAIAFGHPLAATGVRLTLTILRELKRSKGRYGVASACIGGGQGIAIVVEVA